MHNNTDFSLCKYREEIAKTISQIDEDDMVTGEEKSELYRSIARELHSQPANASVNKDAVIEQVEACSTCSTLQRILKLANVLNQEFHDPKKQTAIPHSTHTHCSLPQSKKLFSAIHLSYALKASQYEGGNPQESIDFLRNALAALDPNSTHRETKTIQNASAFFLAISQQIAAAKQQCITQKTSVDAACQPITEAILKGIKAMKAEESLILPIGWAPNSDTTGHAMLLEVVREAEDRYSLFVHNPGAGLELGYHAQKGERYQFAMQISASLQEVCNAELYNALMSFRIAPAVNNQTVSPQAIYDVFAYLFAEKITAPDETKAPFQKPQKAGTCFWTVFKSLIGKNKFLLRQLQSLSLQQFYHHFSNELILNAEEQALFISAIERWAGKVHRDIAEQRITAEKEIEALKKELDIAMKMQKQVEMHHHSVLSTPSPLILPQDTVPSACSELTALPQHKRRKNNDRYFKNFCSPFDFPPLAYTESAEAIIQNLKTFQQHIKIYNEDTITTQLDIEKMVNLLPLPQSQNTFWDTMTGENASQFAFELLQIQKQYQQLCGNENPLRSESLLCFDKLLVSIQTCVCNSNISYEEIRTEPCRDFGRFARDNVDMSTEWLCSLDAVSARKTINDCFNRAGSVNLYKLNNHKIKIPKSEMSDIQGLLKAQLNLQQQEEYKTYMDQWKKPLSVRENDKEEKKKRDGCQWILNCLGEKHPIHILHSSLSINEKLGSTSKKEKENKIYPFADYKSGKCDKLGEKQHPDWVFCSQPNLILFDSMRYYQSNWKELSDGEHCLRFFSLIVNHAFITTPEEQLHSFATCLDFLQQGISFFSDQFPEHASVFFSLLQMTEYLKSMMESSKQRDNFKEKVKAITHFENQILESIFTQSGKLEQDTAHYLSALRLLVNLSQPTEENAAELLNDLLTTHGCDIMPNSPDENQNHFLHLLQKQVKQRLYDNRDQLAVLWKEEELRKGLTQHQLMQESDSLKKKESHFYTIKRDEKSHIKLNLLTGTVLSKGGILPPFLPRSIQTASHVQELKLTDAKPTATIPFGLGHAFVVRVPNKDEFTISAWRTLRKWKGQTWEYMTTEKKEKCVSWITPFEIWRSNDDKAALICDPDTHNPLYQMENGIIYQLDSNGEQISELKNELKGELGKLFQWWSPALLWEERNSSEQYITLPAHYGPDGNTLSFSVRENEGKVEIESRQYPGFFLSAAPPCGQWSGYSTIGPLFLKNAEDKWMVLFPEGQLQQRPSKGILKHEDFEANQLKRQSTFVFHTDSSGQLQAKNAREWFYLAATALNMQNVEESARCFSQLFLLSDSDEFIEMKEEILPWLKLWLDENENPNHLRLGLLAYFMLFSKYDPDRYEQYLQLKDKKQLKNFLEHYQRVRTVGVEKYLQGCIPLSQEAEKEYFDALTKLCRMTPTSFQQQKQPVFSPVDIDWETIKKIGKTEQKTLLQALEDKIKQRGQTSTSPLNYEETLKTHEQSIWLSLQSQYTRKEDQHKLGLLLLYIQNYAAKDTISQWYSSSSLSYQKKDHKAQFDQFLANAKESFAILNPNSRVIIEGLEPFYRDQKQFVQKKFKRLITNLSADSKTNVWHLPLQYLMIDYRYGCLSNKQEDQKIEKIYRSYKEDVRKCRQQSDFENLWTRFIKEMENACASSLAKEGMSQTDEAEPLEWEEEEFEKFITKTSRSIRYFKQEFEKWSDDYFQCHVPIGHYCKEPWSTIYDSHMKAINDLYKQLTALPDKTKFNQEERGPFQQLWGKFTQAIQNQLSAPQSSTMDAPTLPVEREIDPQQTQSAMDSAAAVITCFPHHNLFDAVDDSSLEKSIQESGQLSEQYRGQILERLNRNPHPDSSTEYFQWELKRTSGMVAEKTIEDAQRYFLHLHQLESHCFFGEKERRLFEYEMECYLFHRHRSEYGKRLRALPESERRPFSNQRDYLSSTESGVETTPPLPQWKKVALLYEVKQGTLLRPRQQQVIERLMNKGEVYPSLAEEIMMGEGKSKVLLPILAQAQSDGKQVPFLVIPRALFGSAKKDMQTLSLHLFRQPLQTFDFSRDAIHQPPDVAIRHCREIRSLLYNAQKYQEAVMVIPETIQAIALSKRELLAKPNKTEDEKTLLSLLDEIETFLQRNGHAIFDEIDETLHCKKEMHFTLNTPSSATERERDFVFQLYRVIHAKGFQQRVQKEGYGETIKEELIDQVWRQIHAQTKQTYDPREVKRYLKGEKSDHYPLLKPRCEDSELFALAKGMIQQIFSITLPRRANINFGLSHSPSASRKYAIPYIGKDEPQESSDYSSIWESLGYTSQLYFTKGIPKQDLVDWIASFRQRAKKEAEDSQGELAWHQTAAAEQFHNITGELLPSLDEKQFDDVIRFEQKPKLFEAYLKECVFSHIKAYDTSLSYDNIELADLFRSVQGFSGTLASGRTFHDKIQIQRFEQDTERLLKKLSEAGIATHAIASEEKKIDQLFSNLTLEKETFRAIIDVRGQFEGISNESVARSLGQWFQQHDFPIKATLYFHEHQLHLYDIKKGACFPLSGTDIEQQLRQFNNDQNSNYRLDELFTYYDQSHTRGTDIKQIPTAHAVVTAGKDTFSRQLLQGIKRFRGIEAQQTMQLLITDDLEREITKKNGQLNFDAVHQYCKEYETNQLKEEYYHSIRQKLANCCSRLVLQQFDELNEGEKAELVDRYPVFSNWLVQTGSSRPSEIFEQELQYTDPIEALENYRQELLQRIKNSESELPLQKRYCDHRHAFQEKTRSLNTENVASLCLEYCNFFKTESVTEMRDIYLNKIHEKKETEGQNWVLPLWNEMVEAIENAYLPTISLVQKAESSMNEVRIERDNLPAKVMTAQHSLHVERQVEEEVETEVENEIEQELQRVQHYLQGHHSLNSKQDWVDWKDYYAMSNSVFGHNKDFCQLKPSLLENVQVISREESELGTEQMQPYPYLLLAKEAGKWQGTLLHYETKALDKLRECKQGGIARRECLLLTIDGRVVNRANSAVEPDDPALSPILLTAQIAAGHLPSLRQKQQFQEVKNWLKEDGALTGERLQLLFNSLYFQQGDKEAAHFLLKILKEGFNIAQEQLSTLLGAFLQGTGGIQLYDHSIDILSPQEQKRMLTRMDGILFNTKRSQHKKQVWEAMASFLKRHTSVLSQHGEYNIIQAHLQANEENDDENALKLWVSSYKDCSSKFDEDDKYTIFDGIHNKVKKSTLQLDFINEIFDLAIHFWNNDNTNEYAAIAVDIAKSFTRQKHLPQEVTLFFDSCSLFLNRIPNNDHPQKEYIKEKLEKHLKKSGLHWKSV